MKTQQHIKGLQLFRGSVLRTVSRGFWESEPQELQIKTFLRNLLSSRVGGFTAQPGVTQMLAVAQSVESPNQKGNGLYCHHL